MNALVLVRSGEEVQVVELLEPVHLGRASTSDLVLLDDTVSAHHCVVWQDDDAVWVEDLSSRNGTWIDEVQVSGPTRLEPGQTLRLGSGAGPTLLLRATKTDTAAQDAVWQLEDRTANTRMPLRTDRFRIGSGTGCDLRLPSGPPVAATLMVHGTGEIWIGEDEEDRPLSPGQPFLVAGRELLLVPPAEGRVPTVLHDPDRYDYRVQATLGSPVPKAVVEDRRGDKRWTTEDDNRALLLYLLARRFDKDRLDPELPPNAWGWIDDEALVTGVWGRNRPADEVNSLNVLIHRIRRGVKKAGLDPWFLEKQRRAVRIRVAEVQVA